MLGLISRQPLAVGRYLWEAPRSLHWLSHNGLKAPHIDGFGLAYKDAYGLMHVQKWGREELAELEAQSRPKLARIQSALLIAHARQASVAYKHMTSPAEAHPFFEGSIYLAHNGTIKDANNLGTAEGTDTQKLLRWLVGHWTTRNPSGLAEALQKLLTLVKDYTAINLLITEGSNLYAFCCYRGEPEYYTLYYRVSADLAVVASEPLDEDFEAWQPLSNREMLQITPDLEMKRSQIV